MEKKIFDRVIITGCGGCGKDYLKAYLRGLPGYACSVSHTTRPIRDGEVEGVNYHYVSMEEFQAMIKTNEFKEWNRFYEEWYYGTTLENFNAANLFIMTPSGIRALSERERNNSYIIFIDIPEEVRSARLYERGGADSPERRLESDRKDFHDFRDYDERIVFPKFNVEKVHEELSKIIRKV